ncbi:MAG: hypothetical protein GXY08_03410 [Ruminococcus sp.]|nr:hypothetical protein [Ruminococcus sp.]
MGRKLKRILLCIIAVSCVTTCGNIHADDEDFTEPSAGEETAAEENGQKRSEAEENPEIDAVDVKKYMTKAGSSEGYDVYIYSDETEAAIWRSHGFSDGKKPGSKNKLTEAQKEEKKAAEDEIKRVKKMGDGALIDISTGAVAAELKELGSRKDIKSYISDKGRFIADLDKEPGSLIAVKRIISTLDSKNVFLSDGGRTLERMSSDNKKVEEVLVYDRTEDGMRVYTGDKGRFAWVSEDMGHFFGIYRCATENEELRMLVDDINVNIGLENKATGYIWWSAPIDSTQDTYATDLLVDDLRSSSVMAYGKPESRISNNMLRSNTKDCTMKVTDIKDGIKVTYDYEAAGFSFPVEYTLCQDYLKASLDVDEIEESKSANVATDVRLLGGFGAASDKEDGYFVIPDGCGALVRFNNNRTMAFNSYSQKVYGPDVTNVPVTRGAVTEQIYLPVYGIVKEDNAMLVVAAKGDSNATLSVNTSKQSKTSYNICNFSFTLRGTDTYYMTGNTRKAITVFERGGIKSDDIELRYYPIAEKGADYADIAGRYREYLLDEGGVTVRAKAESAPLYVDLYGGVMKKRPILGIPINMKTSVTGYSQAEEILSRLNSDGVDEMVVSYKNWTSDGIKNKIDTDASPSWTLGGRKKFNSLKDYAEDNDISFYPVSDNRDFYSGNGYFSFTSTAVRVSGNYSRIVSYDRAYGIPDGFKKNMSLISPRYFDKIFSDLSKNYSDAGLEGVSVDSLTASLYGDYGKKAMSRYDTMQTLTDSYEELSSELGDGMLAKTANAYALPYVSHITNVPLTSSRFDIFDEDIPFYQMVIHGVIPYSTKAINGSSDPGDMLLSAVSAGSNLCYDMIWEETSLLKDTEFDVLYYANSRNWTETAAAEYRLLAPILGSVSDKYITDYKTENDGQLITAGYSDGTVIRTDLSERWIEAGGQRYELSQLEKEGDVRF